MLVYTIIYNKEIKKITAVIIEELWYNWLFAALVSVLIDAEEDPNELDDSDVWVEVNDDDDVVVEWTSVVVLELKNLLLRWTVLVDEEVSESDTDLLEI